MKSLNTLRLLFAIAVTFGFGVVSNLSVASAAPQQGCDCSTPTCSSCRETGMGIQCPQCADSFVPPPQEYCELKITDGKETRTCYEVDYKSICIPKVVPPWRQCCEPLCAETRSVKVLKTRKYECPACQYKWSVKKPEYQQSTPNGESAYFHQNPQTPVPVFNGSVSTPAYGMPLRSDIPVFPAGSGRPVVPAFTGTQPSFIVPSKPVIPPAPPVAGSIGDYFGGR